MSFILIPTTLSANPHFYDYIHFLKLDAQGSVEMIDGAGQALNTLARGTCRIHAADDTTAEFEFIDLVEMNPYQKSKIRDIGPFRVQVVKETGVYAFCEEVVWHIPNKKKWPCILYQTRYVFAEDPLAFGRENQEQNLYHQIERKELVESAKTYYSSEDRIKLSVEEMLQRGITPVGFEHLNYHEQSTPEQARRPWWRFWG